jgi:cell division protein FtsI/penicillin-binding protein 2
LANLLRSPLQTVYVTPYPSAWLTAQICLPSMISGKTGTASNPPRKPWSHGWFAGFATIRRTPLVISLYIPRGSGADAALLARDFFVMRDKAAA